MLEALKKKEEDEKLMEQIMLEHESRNKKIDEAHKDAIANIESDNRKYQKNEEIRHQNELKAIEKQKIDILEHTNKVLKSIDDKMILQREEHKKKMNEMDKKNKEDLNKMDKDMNTYIQNYNLQKQQRQRVHDNTMRQINQQNQIELNRMNNQYYAMKKNYWN